MRALSNEIVAAIRELVQLNPLYREHMQYFTQRVDIADPFKLVRSRRPVVLPSTRVHLTMPWVVSCSSLRPFGPRRGRRGVSERQRSRRWRLHETAPPRRRRRDPTRVYVVIRTPSTRCHIGPSRATAMLRAGRLRGVPGYGERSGPTDGAGGARRRQEIEVGSGSRQPRERTE